MHLTMSKSANAVSYYVSETVTKDGKKSTAVVSLFSLTLFASSNAKKALSNMPSQIAQLIIHSNFIISSPLFTQPFCPNFHNKSINSR